MLGVLIVVADLVDVFGVGARNKYHVFPLGLEVSGDLEVFIHVFVVFLDPLAL